MKKVGASKKSSRIEDEACIVINRIHSNSTNKMVGRMLNPDLPDPGASFHKELKSKKLSPMITRIWNSLGVPDSICEKYTSTFFCPGYLNHAFAVGLADPTFQLPSGSCFMTGLHHMEPSLTSIFVTRSPCIEPSDGRIVPLISHKPDSMSQENWDWLLTLPFGAIIFANSKPNEILLPEVIASGDLDGDLYFVCWNQAILSEIRAEPIDLEKDHEQEIDDLPEESYDPEWLIKAQEMMIDASAIRDLSRLIGKASAYSFNIHITSHVVAALYHGK